MDPVRPSPRIDTFARLQTAAFTLIELLCVMAVIGLLAAIVVSVTGKVRQSARMTQSVSNLRTLGHAVLSFANDNDQRMPELTDVSESGGFGGNFWTLQIGPYLPEPIKNRWLDLDNIPRTLSPPLISPFLENGQHHRLGDYGASNQVMLHNSPPLYLSQISHPSQTVMLAASETRTRPLPSGSWFFNATAYVNSPDSTAIPAPSTHGADGIPVAFTDGRVEVFSETDFKTKRRDLLLVNR